MRRAVILSLVLAACSRTNLDEDTADAMPDPCAGCVGACIAEHCSLPKQIAAAASHTCVRLETGEVMCWGSNESGILGTGQTDALPHSVPVQIPALHDVVEIAVSDTHACARHADGTVSCWGSNAYGELGHEGGSTAPSQVVEVHDARFVGVGPGWSCAGSKEGVSCWGNDQTGQLGDRGVALSSPHPLVVPLPVLPGTVSSLALGAKHGCAVTTTGEVWCWGSNAAGQMGNGTATGDPSSPSKVSPLAWVTGASSGADDTCVTRLDSVLTCWGGGSPGAYPLDTRNAVEVVGVALSQADGACVLQQAGAVACGTVTLDGKLGAFTFDGTLDLNQGAIAVATGTGHDCALLQDGRATCWGDNTLGQLGDGTTDSRSAAGDVSF